MKRLSEYQLPATEMSESDGARHRREAKIAVLGTTNSLRSLQKKVSSPLTWRRPTPSDSQMCASVALRHLRSELLAVSVLERVSPVRRAPATLGMTAARSGLVRQSRESYLRGRDCSSEGQNRAVARAWTNQRGIMPVKLSACPCMSGAKLSRPLPVSRCHRTCLMHLFVVGPIVAAR